MHFGTRFAKVYQLGYVTRDMDTALDYAKTQLGLTRFDRFHSPAEVWADGKRQTLDIKIALAFSGSRQIEIIEPVSGPIELYTDAIDLDAQILTFHHVAIAIPGPFSEWQKLVAEVNESGDEMAIVCPPEPGPGDAFCLCYVDTRARLGHYVEYAWTNAALKGKSTSDILREN